MINHTGRGGINKHMIGKKLGVSMKKMKKRMDEMVIRYGIIETNEQAGKQVIPFLKWHTILYATVGPS